MSGRDVFERGPAEVWIKPAKKLALPAGTAQTIRHQHPEGELADQQGDDDAQYHSGELENEASHGGCQSGSDGVPRRASLMQMAFKVSVAFDHTFFPVDVIVGQAGAMCQPFFQDAVVT